jgi:heme exporter protein D
MTLAEYFSFLPYGKYAFYIWVSYLSASIMVFFLFIKTHRLKQKIHAQLQLKYNREND